MFTQRVHIFDGWTNTLMAKKVYKLSANYKVFNETSLDKLAFKRNILQYNKHKINPACIMDSIK